MTGKPVGGKFSLQSVLEEGKTVQKGWEMEGEEADEALPSESTGALSTRSYYLHSILYKLFTNAQRLNYGDVSSH